jgi:foldase protein PrsA
MSNNHHPLTHKALVAMALVVFLGGGFTAGTWYWVNRYDFVAKVNGERITRTAFARNFEQAQQMYARQLGTDLNSEQGKALLPMVRQSTLEQLISQQLLLQEVAKRNIQILDSEVEAEFEQYLKTSYKDDRARMEAELARNNFSVSDFRKELKTRLALKKMREELGKGLKLTEQQVQDYYNQNKQSFNQTDKIEAAHILIKVDKPAQDAAAKQEIEKILAELKAGADFKTLAKKYSQDTSNKDKGGDLGAFAKGDMVQAFETAAWALKPGEYTQTPVKTEFGYHLILRGKTIKAGPQALADVRKQFEPQLMEQEKAKRYNDWLKAQRKASEIVLAEDMLPPPAPPMPPSNPASGKTTPQTEKATDKTPQTSEK